MAAASKVLASICVVSLLTARPSLADDKKGDDGGEATLDTIKAGRLARNGVTAGIALAAHVPLTDSVNDTGTGSMAYVESTPLLLSLGKISRAYCVARYTASNAQQVADRVAMSESGLTLSAVAKIEDLTENDITTILRDRALVPTNMATEIRKAAGQEPAASRGIEERVRMHKDADDLDRVANGKVSVAEFGFIKDRLGAVQDARPAAAGAIRFQSLQNAYAIEKTYDPQLTLQSAIADFTTARASGAADEAIVLDEVLLSLQTAASKYISRAQFKALDSESKKVILAKFVDHRTGWKLGMAGSGCWRSALGIYVGLPGSFGANVDFSDKKQDGSYSVAMSAKGELAPIVSFGFTVSPISEIRLMVGLTASNVVLKKDGPESRVWSLTIGLGGNFDIAGALLAK